MSEERHRPTALDYSDWSVLLASAVAAVGYAVIKTPLAFWLPAWLVQAITFSYALSRRDGAHWPSTLFGIFEVFYIGALVTLLGWKHVSLSGLTQLFFGLIFVHGILYLIAAKPFLIRRGYIKPKKA